MFSDNDIGSRLESPGRFALGIDVGGTKIAAGLIQFPKALILERREIETLPLQGGFAVLQRIVAMADELAAIAESQGFYLEGVALCLCELVNQHGEIVSTESVDWRNVPYRESLSRIAPVQLDADVRAAALGEARFGAGRDYSVFLYVTIGTGISACLIIDGKPYMGAKGLAGTIASSPLPGHFPNSGAPHPASLEQLASGPALAAQYQTQTGNKLTGQQVSAAVQNGDSVAREVMKRAGGSMGAVIGWLINTLDPEAVILGGGVGAGTGAGNDVYRESLVESARRHTWSKLHQRIPIIPAALRQDAGIVGAASQSLPGNAGNKKTPPWP